MHKHLPQLKLTFLILIFFIFSFQLSVKSMPLDKDKQALVKALEENNIPAIKKLTRKIYHYDMNFNNDVKQVKPLLLAIHDGWNDIAMQLIIDKVGLNDNDKGQTVLTYACSYMRLDIIKMLLSKGLNPNQLDDNGKSILASIGDMAIWDGPAGGYDKIRYAIANLLIKHGANVNSKDQPIFKFCTNLDLLKLLIHAGADYEVSPQRASILSKIPIDSKTTLLHFAASDGNKAIIDYLIELGLSVNQPNEYGWTPLHFGAYAKNLSTVDALLQKSADKTIKTIRSYQCLAYNIISPLYDIGLTPYDIATHDIVVTAHYNAIYKKQFDTILLKLKITN